MGDLMVLVFQNDLICICIFMLVNEGSNKNYCFIGVLDGYYYFFYYSGNVEK